MLIIIRSKINSESLKQVAEDLKGYVKVVVDIKREFYLRGRKACGWGTASS